MLLDLVNSGVTIIDLLPTIDQLMATASKAPLVIALALAALILVIVLVETSEMRMFDRY